MLFVQDQTGSTYVVAPRIRELKVQAGDLVDLTGITSPGQFAPIIVVHFTVHFESPDFLVPHSKHPSPINLNLRSRELRHISSCKSFMEPILRSPS